MNDVRTLRPGTFLNDSIIEFWANFIFTSKSFPAIQNSHCFNPFLWRMITDEPDVSRWSGWGKKIDMFSFKFLLFPICQEYHWSLAIVCNFNPSVSSDGCILYLDSLDPKRNSTLVFQNIRAYLSSEWTRRKGAVAEFNDTSFPGFSPLVPLQPNSYDCGIYVVQFIESFLEYPYQVGDFNASGYQLFPSQHLIVFNACVSVKRTSIFDQINALRLSRFLPPLPPLDTFGHPIFEPPNPPPSLSPVRKTLSDDDLGTPAFVSSPLQQISLNSSASPSRAETKSISVESFAPASLSYKELQERCKRYGLSARGSKIELCSRLTEFSDEQLYVFSPTKKRRGPNPNAGHDNSRIPSRGEKEKEIVSKRNRPR